MTGGNHLLPAGGERGRRWRGASQRPPGARTRRVPGPGPLVFSPAKQPTSATFTQPGEYVLRVRADNFGRLDTSPGNQRCWTNWCESHRDTLTSIRSCRHAPFGTICPTGAHPLGRRATTRRGAAGSAAVLALSVAAALTGLVVEPNRLDPSTAAHTLPDGTRRAAALLSHGHARWQAIGDAAD